MVEINEYESNLYPKLDDYENDKYLMSEINRLKIDNFMNEKKVLEDLLEHYKKLKSKYTKIDSSFKFGCILIGGITTIGSAVITGVPTLGTSLLIYIPVGISIFSAVNLFIGESISLGFTSRKKKIYREICESIEHSIDKLYLYQIKALEDSILSNDEIEKAKIIINECKENIKKIKNNKEYEKLEKDAKTELKQKIKKEMEEKLKNLK